MFWIALAAAAQVSAPVPAKLKALFSYEDVPSYLIRRGSGLWWVGIRLTVDPGGIIRACEIETTSRIAELDALTCRLAHQRGKFGPAHFADGSAAWGVYRTSIMWVVADAPVDTSKLSNPDLDLTVQNLPPGVKSPTLVRVMFAVDQLGRMSSCAAEPSPSFERAENIPALVPVACDQLMRSYKAVPAKDTTGAPVASVQDATVRFSTDRH